MRPLRHWLGLHIRRDWAWLEGCPRPTLALRQPLQPGWYMLSVRVECEQQRCYGRLNGLQSRLLIQGRLRRRLIRISKATRSARFELLGLNGTARLAELRLARQPFWRVQRLLRNKLQAMHPAYGTSASRPRQGIGRLWRDYNQLLGRRTQALVGYDDWIEQIERPLLLEEQRCAAADPAEAPSLRISVWLHGDRQNAERCAASIASLEQQLRGGYQLLEPTQPLLAGDPHTWVLLLQAGDALAPQALRRLAATLRNHSESCVVYADEDRITATGRRHSPQFKPAWNPDLLYSDPHYSHCWLIRSDICLQAAQRLHDNGEDLSLYAVALEATGLSRPEQIVHLPEILYHRRDDTAALRSSTGTAASLQAFLMRRGQAVRVTHQPGGGHVLHWPLPDPAPLVSVIIPTRDQHQLLRCCLTALFEHDDGAVPMEILVIDNGSSEPESLAYLNELAQQAGITVLRRPGRFNYAALNNDAVAIARGELLAFLNNDVEATHPGWLAVMAAQALRPEIGAVGAKLLYEDGTIQHGGVLLGIGGIAGHAHKYLPAEAEGYHLRLQVAHNLSAVTAAALVVRRSVFNAVGGFDSEQLAVNYNDVDLCLRLMQAGYRNLFCPQAVLVHFESKTRGAPVEGQEAYRQWQQERQTMLDRWGALLQADPHYSPHLSLVEEDLSLSLKTPAPPLGRSAPFSR